MYRKIAKYVYYFGLFAALFLWIGYGIILNIWDICRAFDAGTLTATFIFFSILRWFLSSVFAVVIYYGGFRACEYFQVKHGIITRKKRLKNMDF